LTLLIFLKYPPKPGVRKPSFVQAGIPDASKPTEQPQQTAPAPASATAPASPAQAASDNADEGGKAEKPATAQKDSKPKDEKVFQDPLSRAALSLVGVDSDAEEYWLGAVFDPGLPKSERQDLIDDLNEEGLSDPKHPTEEDLPMLYARLEMLESLIPWIDGVLEWDEPREDLLNLIANAMGGGHPVN
jgi:hypothetical protein